MALSRVDQFGNLRLHPGLWELFRIKTGENNGKNAPSNGE
jgi:hypothetical protein